MRETLRQLPREPSRKVQAIALLLLLLVWFVTWLPRLRGPIDLRWDGSVYYILGTALAQGRGYRLLNEPGAIHSVQYPPGLPAIVAAHQRLLGTDDPVRVGVALRRFYIGLSGLFVLSVYWLLRSHFGSVVACLGAAVATLNMTIVWVSDRCYSDLPFLVAATAFVGLSRATGPSASAMAGAVAIAAFLLRTVGAALLLAWVGSAVFARAWRAAAIRLTLTVLLLGGWQGYVWLVQQSPEYQTPAYPYQRAPYLLYNVSYTTNASLKRPFFPHEGRVSPKDVGQRFVGNVINVPAAIGEVLTTSSDNWYSYLERVRTLPVVGLAGRWRAIRAGLVLLGLLTLAGLGLLWRRGFPSAGLVVLVYVLGVCVMTFSEEFARYLTGLQPLFLLGLFSSVLAISPQALRRRSTWIPFSVVLVTMLAAELPTLLALRSGLTQVTHRSWRGHDVTYRLFTYPESFRSFDEAIEWVSSNSTASDVIASSQPHWVYLRTSRRAVMPPFERGVARQQELLDSVPVSLAIVDSDGFSATREYSLPALESEDAWERVYRTADGLTEVYRRIGGPRSDAITSR